MLTAPGGFADGSCCGEPAENKKLMERFEPVGDEREGAGVGHVASGGSGALIRSRRYGERLATEVCPL